MKPNILSLLLLTFAFSLLQVGCGTKKADKSALPKTKVDTAKETVATDEEIIAVVGEIGQLTFDPSDNGLGNYHPDGEKIIFQSNRHGNWQIYELNLADSLETRLIRSEYNDENPLWSPTGEFIVFVSNQNTENEWERDLVLYNPLDEVKFPLTYAEGDDWYPVFIDEKNIVFLSERNSSPDSEPLEKRNSFYTLNVDGGAPTLIAGVEQNLRGPEFYMGNEYFVLTEDWKLALFNSVTKKVRILSPNGIKCSNPDYLDAYGLLTFAGRENEQYFLYLMRLDNKDIQRIDLGGAEARYPRFSPDGNWILYSAETDGNFQLLRIPIEIKE